MRRFSPAACLPALLLSWAALAVGNGSPAGAAETADFRLQEYLGRAWHNECVTFPLNAGQAGHVQAGHALLGPNGQPVPYQRCRVAGGDGIALLTDLDPFTTREFRFADAPAKAGKPLAEVSKDRITLSNQFIGIELRTKLAPGQGPIARIRLNSGAWVGDSTLTSDQPLTAYAAKVTARGPVFAEAVCQAACGANAGWELRVRLHADEPVVLVEERFDVPAGNGTRWAIDLGRNLNPDTLLYRTGQMHFENTTYRIAPGEVFFLEPWLHWWERKGQGHCFSLYKSAGGAEQPPAGADPQDTISIGACDAGFWVDPAIPADQRAPSQLVLTQTGDALTMAFPLKRGARRWMISALNTKECLAGLAGKPAAPGVLLPNKYLIKHGHFPLDVVKNLDLAWKGDQDSYPRLFLTKANLETFRRDLPNPERFTARLEEFRRGKYGQYSLDGQVTPTAVYFVTGDEEVGKQLALSTVELLQSGVNMYLDQEGQPLGTAPHIQYQIAPAIAMADAGLASDTLTPELRERILAQLAFLGYVFDSPAYWSTARGFNANPNMTTAVYGYKLMVACLIPSHPKAKDWAGDALAELRNQLTGWSDENGGWLECPHYAAAGFDQLIASLVMAHNAGLDDSLYSPRLKKIAEWLGKISTPPDSRLGGFRHLPPIGNSYLQEPTGIFGTMASLWKERDPEFAAQMQWMFEQQRSWPNSCIGGGYPGMVGVNGLFRGSNVPPKAPAWGSELFPRTGAILRDAFPSPRETQLHMIAGTNHEHYDDDSGSVTLWGKGRIVADDFGYVGLAPQTEHNLLLSPGLGGVMTVKDFSTAPALDYLHGVKDKWTRQIAFVKSTDPMAPAYFVFTDSLSAPAQYTWQMWLTARNVIVGDSPAPGADIPVEADGTAMDQRFATATAASRALMVGREDVDADFFFLSPAPSTLRTEKKTRPSLAGLDAEGKEGPRSSTQIGLIAESPSGPGTTVLVYPRLKTAVPPTVTAIAGGRGAKVQTEAGTDYVFLSPVPVTYAEGDVSFSGTVGSVQLRGNEPVLSLGAAGKIAARGKQLEK